MSKNVLTTYLNDHLAGSVAALELLDLLLRTRPAGENEPYSRLGLEIEEDQRVLRELIERLGGKESRVRKAAAWLTGKLGRAKFQFDDEGHGELRTIEALEALGLGIQGKLALWRTLEAVAASTPELRAWDFPRLQERAMDQFARVDRLRLQAARAAFG
ncbi:MAG TPA: hypothetical protein VE399_05780 [Gemmatimonadales bacterium]|jgi:hypothetical protein|nr:hypothetical protein [Gemmatimonadales bacterium]